MASCRSVEVVLRHDPATRLEEHVDKQAEKARHIPGRTGVEIQKSKRGRCLGSIISSSVTVAVRGCRGHPGMCCARSREAEDFGLRSGRFAGRHRGRARPGAPGRDSSRSGCEIGGALAMENPISQSLIEIVVNNQIAQENCPVLLDVLEVAETGGTVTSPTWSGAREIGRTGRVSSMALERWGSCRRTKPAFRVRYSSCAADPPIIVSISTLLFHGNEYVFSTP